MTLTPIPTAYEGGQYRSRLEARWAAFFDLMRIPYIYEPIDAGGYIPDFLIPGKRPLFVEVGPVLTEAEYREKATKGLRAIALGHMTGDLLVVGTDPVGRGLGLRWPNVIVGLHWQGFVPFGRESDSMGADGKPYVWDGLMVGADGRVLYNFGDDQPGREPEDVLPYGCPATIGTCIVHGDHGDVGSGCGSGYVINTIQQYIKNPCGSYEGGRWSGEYSVERVDGWWREAGSRTQWHKVPRA